MRVYGGLPWVLGGSDEAHLRVLYHEFWALGLRVLVG